MTADHKLLEAEKVYMCPSSGVSFRGCCPVITCPANISHVRNKEPGCAYLVLNTPTLNPYNLAYVFKIPVKKVKERISKDKRRIYASLFIAEAFEKHVTLPKHQCENCGVGLLSGSACINNKKCRARVNLFKKRIRRFPFNNKLLKVDPVRFYAFCACLPEIKNAFSSIMSKTSMSFSDLIGIRQKTLSRMVRLSGPLARAKTAKTEPLRPSSHSSTKEETK